MNKQTKNLAVLIVEDMESDAELLVRLLKKSDYELAYEQVDTSEQMRAALEKRTWDIVISDYKMPQFDGRAALQLLQDSGCDIPFIVVSGTIGEETAVSMMKAGAHDYLIKGDLGRLVPAVKRELEQAEIRRGHRQVEKALADSEVELRALFSSMQDVVLVIDRHGFYRKIAPTNPGLLVKPASNLLGMNLRDVFPAEKAEFFIDAIRQVLETKQTTQIEYEHLIGDRSVWFETSISPMDTDSTLWVARDVSGRKQMEEQLRESEEKHRAFIEQSSEGILLVNEQGNILEWNHAREVLSGLKSEDVLGRPYWDVRLELSLPEMRTADTLQKFKSTTFEMLQTGQSPFFNKINEGKLVTKGGEIKNIEQISFPIKTKKGYCVGSVMRDITERRRVEEALLESEARYRRLADHAPDIIFRYDIQPAMKLAYISPSVQLITGYTPQECYADPLLMLNMIHPDDKDLMVSYTQSLTLPEEPLFVRWIGKDGVTRWMESRIVPIKDVDGQLIAVEGITRDISARKQAESALRESEDRYRMLVESSPDGIGIHCEGKIVYVNAAMVKLLHANGLKDLIGKSTIQFVHPDHQAIAMEQFRRSYDNHEASPLLIEKFITVDGQLIDVEVSTAPIIYSGKEATQIIMRDVTERKQAEQALATSEAKLRALVEQMPAIVYTESAETRETLYISPQAEKITGCTPAEWIEDHDLWKKIIHPADVDAIIKENDRTSLTHEPFLVEYRILTQGGRMVWIRDEAVMIQNQDGTPLFWQGVMYDITERRQAEEALAASEAKLRALVEQVPATVYTDSAEAKSPIYVSPQIEKLTGYTPAEWVEDHDLWKKIIHSEDLEAIVEENNRTSLTHAPLSAEYRILTRDGRTLWIHDEAVMIGNQDGTSSFWQGVMYDITERKRAEDALREITTKLETLIRVSPLAIILLDVGGNVLIWNPAAERIFGWNAQEIMGHLNPIVPVDKQNEYSDWSDKVIQGDVLNNQDALRQRKDGSLVNVSISSAVIYDSVGNVNGRMAIIADITERKRAEESSQISEKRYRELFNGMLDGFALHEIICDENNNPVDYRFLEVNPSFERLTGLQSADIVGKTVLEVMPNTEQYWIEVYGNVALTRRSTFFENYSGELDRYFEVSVYSPRLGQFAVIMVDITDRKRAEDDIHRRVTELEMLYQSGLALSQSLNPKEIGQKILELLEEKLDWHHTGILFYHMHNDNLELLDLNQTSLNSEKEKPEVVVEHFQSIVSRCMSDWAIQQGKPVRAGDVSIDPHFIEAYSGIRSGLYVPMKLGENMVGVISIEDERPDAFSEADEHLVATLANQAVNAFENARLFEETRQRVLELETLNRILLVLRAVTKQDEMLSLVLDEALDILHTSHGSIELFNKTLNNLDQTIVRGWLGQLIPTSHAAEGIAGKVFTSGEIYISHEFASDPETRPVARSQIPPGWGGICLPIRTTQQTLGVMIVSMPSEHEPNKNEIRLLSILSEMTGSALQRMQLHEQTVHRLEQLNALRAVDQAISSSRDMRLTLNILLMHTISQLKVDAADVILLNSGLNVLELVGGRGFHTLIPESVRLNDSFAMQAITEHRLISARDVEIVDQYPHFWKLWKEEDFVCYWCVPLVVKGEVKGALEVYCRKAFTPDAEWLEFLEALAGQAAIAIDNTQLFENLQRANMDLNLAYDATIEGWSRAMDLRDHETEGHTLRVTDLTLKLARAMHISESQLTAIRRGALLHDIGKIGVPDSILLKDGKLTEEEWDLMRKHPHLAHDMLAPIAYLNDALDIPYCHHEKWDGTGYPQGLKGDRIPLVARIFAIVDVWDALTNDRPYRKKWTKLKVRQYIKDQSGRHFDPQVVDAFLKNIGKK